MYSGPRKSKELWYGYNQVTAETEGEGYRSDLDLVVDKTKKESRGFSSKCNFHA